MKLRLAFVCAALPFLATNLLAQNLIINGEFETDTFTVYPGYSGGGNPENITGWIGVGNNGINPIVETQNPTSILGWTRNEDSTGQIGINPIADGRAPFADNGEFDGGALFLQGTASVFQTVSGLSLGEEYLLEVEYNARNCCGDVPAVSLELNGERSDQFPNPDDFDADDIFPVEEGFWWLAEIPFVADSDSVLVEFFTEPFDGGDATFVIDNVSLKLAAGDDELIVNGDFEDSLDAFTLFPGYLSMDLGDQRSSPFRDNGNNDTQVALLQNAGSIEQEIEDLTPGVEYTISLDYNARTCCGAMPFPELLIDDEPVTGFSEQVGVVEPVGNGNDWYSFTTTFTAEAELAVFRIQNTSDPDGGDSTLLIDNVFVGLPGSSCNPNTMGDVDGDGLVSFADFLVIAANFGKEVSDHTFGDLDCNGRVEFADFLVNSASFGLRVGGANAELVPEPRSAWLLCVGIVLLARRRQPREGF